MTVADPSAGIAGVASYLPGGQVSATDIAAVSGVPEAVLVERFGLRSGLEDSA